MPRRHAANPWRLLGSAGLAIACAACVGLKDGDEQPPSTQGPDRDGTASDTADGTRDAADEVREERDEDGMIQPNDAPSLTVDAADEDAGLSMDADSSDGADSSLLGASPESIDSADLRLWLEADDGITCDSGRVTRWADRSGNHDDAVLGSGQLGPQCDVPSGAHAVRGVDLPYFSAPQSTPSNIIDETLDVDLAFLAGGDFTIFTVERRWADYAINHGVRNEELIMGTTMPLSLEQSNPVGCPVGYEDVALFVGYVYYDPTLAFVLDHTCDGTVVPADPVPSSLPSPLTEHTARFESGRGQDVWTDGVLENSRATASPVLQGGGGAIGRALLQTTTTGVDPRFRGDIAAVVVYAAALDNAQRAAVEAYLASRWQ